MTATEACTAPILICQISTHANWLLGHPVVLGLCLIAALLIIIGIVKVVDHARAHGFRATLSAGCRAVLHFGYYSFSILKWLTLGTVAGFVAAALTLLVGLSHHFWPEDHGHASNTAGAHAEHASASMAKPEARSAEATVKTAAAEATTAPEPDNAEMGVPAATLAHQADSLAQAAECAVRLARQFPDRKVEVRCGETTIVVHPRDEQGPTRLS